MLFSFFFPFILPCAPQRKVAALFGLRRLQHIDEWNKTLSLLIMRQNVSFFPIIFSVRLLWKLQNKAADIKKKEFISAFYMIQKGTGGMHCMKNPSWPINTASGSRSPWPVTHCRVGRYPYVLPLCSHSFLSVLSAPGSRWRKGTGQDGDLCEVQPSGDTQEGQLLSSVACPGMCGKPGWSWRNKDESVHRVVR